MAAGVGRVGDTIGLGTWADTGEEAALDLTLLVKRRLLVTASSGGGKSWLVRVLAEQIFGKVPLLLVDPEGEFATLRERYGYVLVGPGGETPADVRSAGLVARRLLECRASAVCDLSELPKPERRAWVDGVETPIEKVNVALSAVHVDAGAHTVDVEYVPSSLRLGAAISAATIMLWVAIAMRRRRVG